jgi:hypothetical protein
MKTNIGDIDRLVRVVAGCALLFLFFFGPKSYWALLGVIPIITGFVGYCPLYRVLGLSTCPFDASEKRA